MEDVIQVDDRLYISASSSHADGRTLVLKHGDSFALFDRHGDIQRLGNGEQGVYHEGTRYLSHFGLMINERRPVLLDSTVKQDNTVLEADLTNADHFEAGKLQIPKDTLHIFRSKVLWEGTYYETISVKNYHNDGIDVSLTFEYDADYSDIFEVRGLCRVQRGRVLPAVISENEVGLGYEGLDAVSRRTRLCFSEAPTEITANRARFHVHLTPGSESTVHLAVVCGEGEKHRTLSYDKAVALAGQSLSDAVDKGSTLFSSNEQFNDWLNRSVADLHMLTTETPEGPYPFAGVPWFSTPFGRDGIITALQYLWVDPSIARGVLSFLAATQADEVNPEQEAEPGKILHEMRQGELAALGEIPFARYYGTVDATPLFIVLAGAYFRRTGDRAFIETIWPNIVRALEWIDKYGDLDGDGFVEYARHNDKGLVHLGWKDSDDSVFHADGSDARAPIALCEIQGYVFDAKLTAAGFAELLGERVLAEQLRQQADALKRNFNEKFWCEEISTYALALDGNKNPCCVRSSNAGHLLFSRIVDQERARSVADTLLADESFTGWGVRTLASNERRYNPMSYHNGSVWPHDNAIVAMGLARYGFKEHALRILTGLFDASLNMELNRLPELFCGFPRRAGQGPTLYPVACAPQAWASATAFSLLQTCLGLSFDHATPAIRFHYPQLPDFINWMEIRNLRIGNAVVDLALMRHPQDVGVKVLRKEGEVDIAVIV